MGRRNNFAFDKQPFKNIHLGIINDDRVLSLLYNSVDVITVPSIDDPGPLMVSEALMCKTPIVTFNTGIASEIINDKNIGYKADNFNIESYANGILQYLNTDNTVSNYDSPIYNELTLTNQIRSYKKLFSSLLN